MHLFLLECKKILKQRMHIIVLIAFTVFSLLVYHNMTKEELGMYFHADGTKMSEQEIQAEIRLFKQKFTGEMNEEWWLMLEQEYEKARYAEIVRFVDTDKMAENYGEQWYEAYNHNQKEYAMRNQKGELEEGKKELFYREHSLPAYREDIYYEQVLMLYYNYGSMMVKEKPWNNENGMYGQGYDSLTNEKVELSAYSRINLSEKEILFLKAYMNQKESFYYADSGNWFELLNAFGVIGIFLVLWMILISSTVFNHERSGSMLELLSSNKKGRKQLWMAKTGAVIACGAFATGIMIGVLLLYACVNGQLGNPNVNISERLSLVSIYTYKEAFFMGIVLLLVGVIMTAMIGITCSIWYSSAYLSLAITAIISLLPQLIHFPFCSLFPIQFMEIGWSVVRDFTIQIVGMPFFTWKIILIFSVFVSVMLFVIAYRKFIDKKYPIID